MLNLFFFFFILDERKEADANKCTCEIPAKEEQNIDGKCDCSQGDAKKCLRDEGKCNCDSSSATIKNCRPRDCKCKNQKDAESGSIQTNITKRCNCKCNSRSNTGHSTVAAQVSDNPGILAVAPIMAQADGSQAVRKGKGSKKCCCCDCCHDCCCHDCCCHCCEPCCCCCHCCEPCCCCCHECCCPCCCHCCHCCPCCCHCCCKKSNASERTPAVVNPQIAAAHSKPQHH